MYSRLFLFKSEQSLAKGNNLKGEHEILFKQLMNNKGLAQGKNGYFGNGI